MNMHRYLVVYEKAKGGYSAYAPDLPGCVAAAKSRVECERLMAEAIDMHLAGMAEDGIRPPPPSSFAEVMVVPATQRKSATTR